jgi:hypothetical protein
MTLIEEAESLMLHQFAESARLNSLIKALVRPFQEALDSTDALNHGHYIDDADGPSLDAIGNIVGQSRNGMGDEDFRPWIKVRILLNKNAGTPEHVFAILSILFRSKPNVSMQEYAPNMVIFTFYEFPHCPTKVLFSIIRSALPLGINCRFIKADHPTPTLGINSLKKSPGTNAFQFDVSAFSEAYFADFYEEDSYERRS